MTWGIHLSQERKYVEGYGFLSFARKVGDKYGKKLIDTATKTGVDAAKTASKRVNIGDLIWNKTADKITSSSKTKSKEDNEANKVEEIYRKTSTNYWGFKMILDIV